MGKRDWIIIGAGLLLSALAFVVLLFLQKEPRYVTVYKGNEVYARVKADDYQTLTVNQGDGRVNVVRITPQGVYMESSTCKNQICVQQGVIDPAKIDELPLSGWIVCLPNGVTVEVTGGEEQTP